MTNMTDRNQITLHPLHDSETNELVTADDVGVSEREYADASRESVECGQHEGHVRLAGRRVYAE